MGRTPTLHTLGVSDFLLWCILLRRCATVTCLMKHCSEWGKNTGGLKLLIKTVTLLRLGEPISAN